MQLFSIKFPIAKVIVYLLFHRENTGTESNDYEPFIHSMRERLMFGRKLLPMKRFFYWLACAIFVEIREKRGSHFDKRVGVVQCQVVVRC